MRIPEQIRGLRPATAVWVVYALAWIAPEGNLAAVTILGSSTAVIAAAHLVQRRWGGKRLRGWRWWGGTAVLGALTGGGGALLILLLMAMKTGLHSHGPEFTPAEIAWAVSQIPWWTAGGAVAALGLALLLQARRS
jgi:hypothetical protein